MKDYIPIEPDERADEILSNLFKKHQPKPNKTYLVKKTAIKELSPLEVSDAFLNWRMALVKVKMSQAEEIFNTIDENALNLATQTAENIANLFLKQLELKNELDQRGMRIDMSFDLPI